MARVEYKFWAVDATGAIVPSAAVELRQKSDNSLATLYTTLTGGTTKTNPFNAETDGSASFFAEADRYDLLVGSGASQETIPLDLVDARNGVSFESRSDFVTAVSGGFAAADGSIVFTDGLAYEALSGSTAISDLAGWRPWFRIMPDHFASNATPGTTDMTAAIQAAVDYVAGEGGGEIEFFAQTYLISDTIDVPQRINFVGRGAWFKNQYVDNEFEVAGSVIKLAAGSDVDMFLVRYSVGVGEVINDYRCFVRFQDLVIFGNRSEDFIPSAKDINAAGNGVSISGARYVEFERVIVVKCADDGIECASYDYGGGAVACNNIHVRNSYILSNGGIGVAATGGDSMVHNCQIGYNGLSGISSGGWGLISDNLIWNNRNHGVFVSTSGDAPTIVGNKIYDNVYSGISLGSTTSRGTITGNTIHRNGVSGTGPSQNSGIYIASTETNGVLITGNSIANNTGGTTQDYGIYFNDAACRAVVEGNEVYGHSIRDVTVASPLNLRAYSQGVTVTTSGLTLFDASAAGFDGVVIDVTVAHIGGANAAHCRVLGDTTTPLIISQSSVGSGSFTFSISSGNLVVTSNGSNFTSVASFARVA